MLTDYLFESITEYDIDEPKRFDMKFGGAKQFVLSAVRVKNSVSVWHRILFPRYKVISKSKLMTSEKGLTLSKT